MCIGKSKSTQICTWIPFFTYIYRRKACYTLHITVSKCINNCQSLNFSPKIEIQKILLINFFVTYSIVLTNHRHYPKKQKSINLHRKIDVIKIKTLNILSRITSKTTPPFVPSIKCKAKDFLNLRPNKRKTRLSFFT